MSFATLMVHSCRIDRAIDGIPDPTGHAVESWPPGETVPCLIQSVRGQEITGPQLGGQIISDVRIYLGPTVILAEQDKITDVTPGHKADLYDVQYVESWDYGTAPHKEILALNVGTGDVS